MDKAETIYYGLTKEAGRLKNVAGMFTKQNIKGIYDVINKKVRTKAYGVARKAVDSSIKDHLKAILKSKGVQIGAAGTAGAAGGFGLGRLSKKKLNN